MQRLVLKKKKLIILEGPNIQKVFRQVVCFMSTLVVPTFLSTQVAPLENSLGI